MKECLDELTANRIAAVRGLDPAATERQHAKGKLTARERIDLLLDEGSFQELEQLRRHRAAGFGLEDKRPYTDGVVTGWGPCSGGRCSSMPTTSGSSAVRSARRTRKRCTR